MKKYIFSALCGIVLCSFISTAQSTLSTQDSLPVKNMPKRVSVVKQDKMDILDITGVSSSTFSTSNIFDGTINSYKHSLKITMSLLTSGSPKEAYQLVFYSADDQMPFVANSDAGITYVYYPISLYEAIKQKLDQSFAAKRKVQLKVTQRTDGFREGVLIL
jgi:hypothetical protein